MSTNPTTAIGTPSKPPKWHLLYFALAAFDIIAISASLTLSHNLSNLFYESNTVNQQWAERLADYNQINILAQQVNAPGNDVFDSHDVPKESARLHSELQGFNRKVESTRLDLTQNIDAQMAAPLIEDIDKIQQAMNEMVAEAELIFSYFNDNDPKKAGARMATMDRKYAQVTQAVAAISLAVQDIQADAFAEENARAQSVKVYEYLIAGFIVIMVIGIAAYGHKIQKAMTLGYRKSAEDADTIQRQQEALQEALQSEKTQIYDAINEHCIVSISDVRGNIIEVNDNTCEISGYQRHELIGQNHRLLKSDSHTKEFYHQMWRSIAQGNTWHGIIENKHKQGSRYWVDATIVPFRGTDGKIEKYVAIRNDITKQIINQKELTQTTTIAQEATKAAEQAAQVKSDFLATMSHEIRTPMNGIMGMAHLLLDTELSDEQSLFANTINSSTTALLHILNDVLDYSKIEAEEIEIEATPFEPENIITEITNLLSVNANEKKLKLHTNIPRNIPKSLIGDPGRIRQVLLNLTNNAIKFTEFGSVNIELQLIESKEFQSTIQFHIRDTGLGIPEDKLGILFERFSQVDTSTTRQFGGTGLGLAISKKLVEAMGGSISVSSQENRGSDFYFTLTLQHDNQHQADNAPKTETIAIAEDYSGNQANEEAATENQPAPSILVVDDNKVNLLVVTKMLEKLGYEITTAYDGANALDILKTQTFDLVLMDCQMPVMDGYQATENIRGLNADSLTPPSVPIVALTANAMASDREKCLQVGMDDHLAKPVVFDKLESTLQHWLTTTLQKV